MSLEGGKLIPQKEEGFSIADFVEYNQAVHLLKHDSEKNMVRNAMKFYRNLKEK